MTDVDERSAAARPQVAVVGPADADERELQLGRGVARLLAQAGAVIVTGGLGGVMEAACEGAGLGGGLSIGLLPGTDRSAANPHVGIAVATGLGQGRNLLVVQTADAIVAIGRSPGTLSEIALAARLGKPVVLLASYSDDVVPGCRTAQSPKEAADLALRLFPDNAQQRSSR
jgi:uncharacterized protein (TIGR00725 family)